MIQSSHLAFICDDIFRLVTLGLIIHGHLKLKVCVFHNGRLNNGGAFAIKMRAVNKQQSAEEIYRKGQKKARISHDEACWLFCTACSEGKDPCKLSITR